MAAESKKYPNLFIVGAPKSGTTALAKYLATHRDVYAPLQKEFTFFGKDLVRYAELITKKAYLKWFEPWNKQKYALDASPSYLYSKDAPFEMLQVSPNSKAIIMLRNPAEVAYSMYFEALSCARENVENFEDAWDLEPARVAGENIPPLARLEMTTRYQTIGRYFDFVDHYINVFGEDNVHVIIYDDFKANTKGSYTKLLNFLDLPEEFPEEFKVHNPSTRARFAFISHFASTPPKWMGTVGSFFLPKSVRWKIRDFIAKKNAVPIDKPKIKLETSLKLKLFFREDIKKLEKLLARDLSLWYEKR